MRALTGIVRGWFRWRAALRAELLWTKDALELCRRDRDAAQSRADAAESEVLRLRTLAETGRERERAMVMAGASRATSAAVALELARELVAELEPRSE